jgi:hypothetical protein
MTRTTRQVFRPTRAACALVLVTALACAFAPSSRATGPDRLSRQIGVMEQILEKVLIDSPNFLVRTDNNVRGTYLPDYGAVFSFGASLTTGSDFWGSHITFGPGTVIINKDGHDRRIVHRKGLGDWLVGSRDKDEKEHCETATELYEKGKGELIQMLLDYAETLSALPNGQWVVVAAAMDDTDLAHEKKISRLTLRAGIDDLRAYAAGRLNDDGMKSRIRVDES